jgi:hypothetical protein
MQRAHKVRLKLIADLMLILILTGAYDSIARAVCDYVYAPEMLDRFLDYFGDGFAGAHVAEGAEAVVVPALHGLEGVFEGAADGYDEVVLVQTGADEAAAHVSCAAEDLVKSVSRWLDV